MSRYLLSLTLLAALAAAVAAPEPGATSVRFSSGVQQVTLVELFTSEGCSSCPPADRWLSKLKAEPGLWSRFVPVAFHVDYWDYIGWRDRFAKPAYSDRQREYAREGGVNTVYTPGVFRDGLAWRGWIRSRQIASDAGEVGVLEIEVIDNQVKGNFQPLAASNQRLVLHVALLGLEIESRVNAGENKGRTLKHDFVVLGHSSTRLEESDDVLAGQVRLPDVRVDADRFAVAAWVSSADRQAPIQATGGYVDHLMP